MRVGVVHLEVFEDLAFVPDVIPGGHHVDTEIEEFFGDGRRNAEASGGIFAVGDHQIRRMPLHEFRQTILDDKPPGASEDVTNEKNVQDQSSVVRSQ